MDPRSTTISYAGQPPANSRAVLRPLGSHNSPSTGPVNEGTANCVIEMADTGTGGCTPRVKKLGHSSSTSATNEWEESALE